MSPFHQKQSKQSIAFLQSSNTGRNYFVLPVLLRGEYLPTIPVLICPWQNLTFFIKALGLAEGCWAGNNRGAAADRQTGPNEEPWQGGLAGCTAADAAAAVGGHRALLPLAVFGQALRPNSQPVLHLLLLAQARGVTHPTFSVGLPVRVQDNMTEGEVSVVSADTAADAKTVVDGAGRMMAVFVVLFVVEATTALTGQRPDFHLGLEVQEDRGRAGKVGGGLGQGRKVDATGRVLQLSGQGWTVQPSPTAATPF